MAEVIKNGVIRRSPSCFRRLLGGGPDLSKPRGGWAALAWDAWPGGSARWPRPGWWAADDGKAVCRAILNYGPHPGHGWKPSAANERFLPAKRVALGHAGRRPNLAVGDGPLEQTHDAGPPACCGSPRRACRLQLPKLDAGAMLATRKMRQKVKDGSCALVLPRIGRW